jgi:hypothetical protein
VSLVSAAGSHDMDCTVGGSQVTVAPSESAFTLGGSGRLATNVPSVSGGVAGSASSSILCSSGGGGWAGLPSGGGAGWSGWRENWTAPSLVRVTAALAASGGVMEPPGETMSTESATGVGRSSGFGLGSLSMLAGASLVWAITEGDCAVSLLTSMTLSKFLNLRLTSSAVIFTSPSESESEVIVAVLDGVLGLCLGFLAFVTPAGRFCILAVAMCRWVLVESVGLR